MLKCLIFYLVAEKQRLNMLFITSVYTVYNWLEFGYRMFLKTMLSSE